MTVNGFTIYACITSDAGSGIGALTDAQKKANAQYIYKYLSDKGWSLNAICGLLGNLEKESGINPAEWQTMDKNGHGQTTGSERMGMV